MHHNFKTHKDAWRNAIIIAIENAAPSTVDSDDKGYWEHELKAYDEAFATLEESQ